MIKAKNVHDMVFYTCGLFTAVGLLLAVNVETFLVHPDNGTSTTVSPSRVTSPYSPDQHCTCNVNVRDIPNQPATSCSPTDTSKYQIELEQNIIGLEDQIRILNNTIKTLQDDMSALDAISAELSCARSVAKEIDANVSRLLDHVIVNGTVLRPPSCYSIINLPNGTNPSGYARDCLEFYDRNQSTEGVYTIYPAGSQGPFQVLCDNGWTVIQKRFNDSQSFDMYWDDYSMGFGDLQDNFWLGLEHLHVITSTTPVTIRFEMTGWTGKKYWAEYKNFKIESEANNYAITIENYTGNYKDGMSTVSGKMFSTQDEDNSVSFHDNCALNSGGGWWWDDKCSMSLNSPWVRHTYGYCMKWVDRCVKTSLIKIIPSASLKTNNPSHDVTSG